MSTVLLKDLTPGQQYYVQVRADDGSSVSDWSTRFGLSTTSDVTPPDVPTGLALTVNGDTFVATWTGVNRTSTQNLDFDHYDVSLTNGTTTVVVPTTDVQYTLTFANNRLFFGSPSPTVTAKVRAVDVSRNASAYTSPVSATNPAPGPPTSGVVTPGTDSLDISWTAPSDLDIIGYNIYTGTTSGFTPGSGNKVGFVSATRFSYTTTTYSLQYFKIRSVDEFGQESTDLTVSGTPNSPYIVDTTPPPTPTSLAATITNNANGIGASASVTWVMTSPPSDLAGYNIRYRPVSTTPYQYMYGIDSGVLTATVQYLTAYTNYEFQIQAYDFSSNKSAWSTTYTATSPSNAAPATPTGLTATADSNSITYTWTGVADTDIKNYELTFSLNSGFTGTAPTTITFLNGTSTILTVSGLTPSTTYYARVRANDTGGLSSSFTATTTQATAAPSASSDGVPPSSSPTPTVSGGIGYLFVNWTAITNNDPVTYEVHVSTTTGFTPSGATKAGETMSTIIGLEKDGSGAALAYGTTYYVKLIAKDRDGSAAAGSQGSGTLAQVGAADSTLTAANVGAYSTSQTDTLLAGKNKVNYSTSTPGSTANNAGDIWFQQDGSGNIIAQWTGTGGTSWTSNTITNTVISSLDAGKITSGYINTARLQVGTGANYVVNPGFEQGSTNPHGLGSTATGMTTTATANNGSFAAQITCGTRANGSPGVILTANGPRPTSSATAISVGMPVKAGDVLHGEFYARIGTAVATPNATIMIEIFNAAGTSLTQLSTASVPLTTSYQKVSLDTAALASATAAFATLNIQIDNTTSGDTVFVDDMVLYNKATSTQIADGAISTNLLAANAVTAAKIAAGTITATQIATGTITAASGIIASLGVDKLVAGSGFVASLTVASGGSIQSSNYVANTTGWKISNTGIEMDDNGSSIKADAIKAGTLGGSGGSGIIQVAAGTSLNMNGGYIKSNTNTGTSFSTAVSSGAGFYLGNDGLYIAAGTINAAAIATGTVAATTITLGSGGSIVAGTWTINNSGITIPTGAISAASLNIQTGENLLAPQFTDFEFTPTYYTNNPLPVLNATAAATTSFYRFNSQSMSFSPTNSTNALYFGSSTTDYNLNLQPATNYIVSYYAMVPTAGTSCVPQFQLVAQGTGTNLITTNNDFENTATPNTGWTTTGTGMTFTSQTLHKIGLHSLQAVGTTSGSDTYISQTINITGGQQYTFAAWRYVPSTLTGGAVGNRSLWIQDSTGLSASTSTLSTSTTTGTWVRDTVSITTAAGATTLNVRLYVPNGTVFWDYASLELGATTNPPVAVANNGGAATVPANSTWARYSVTVTMPSTGVTGSAVLLTSTTTSTGVVYFDGLQVEQQLTNSTTPSIWAPSSSTSIDGGAIKTGSIQSTTNTTVNGNSIPVWSIPLNGSASFANLQVRGSAVMGTAADGAFTTLSSANYVQGASGWQLRSDGSGALLQLDAQSVNGSSIQTNTLDAGAIVTSTLKADLAVSGSFTTTTSPTTLDITTTSASTAITTSGGLFYPDDIGCVITSTNIPTTSTVTITGTGNSSGPSTSATISVAANATGTDTGAIINRNRKVSISGAGISLYNAAGIPIVTLPTDPSQTSVFTGSVVTSSLSASGLQMTGTNNGVGTGASVGLSSGTFTPSSGPLISWNWTSRNLTNSDGSQNQPSSVDAGQFYYDPTNNLYYYPYQTSGGQTKLRSFNASGHAGTTYQINQDFAVNGVSLKPYGMCADASNFYLLCNLPAGVTGSYYFLLSIPRTQVTAGSVSSTTTVSVWTPPDSSTTGCWAGIHVYGGNLYIASVRTDNQNLYYQKFTGITTATASLAFQANKGYVGNTTVTSLTVGLLDMGGTNTYAVAGLRGDSKGANLVRVDATTFTSTNYSFPSPNNGAVSGIGLTWLAATTDTSTGFFQFMGRGGTLFDHGTLANNSAASTLNATYKWRNSTATAVGAASPVSTSGIVRRAGSVTITSPTSIPNSGGSTPDSVQFQLETDNTNFWRYAEPAVGALSNTYTAFLTTNAVGTSTNALATGAAATITGTNLSISGSGAVSVNTLKVGASGSVMTVVGRGSASGTANSSSQLTVTHGLGTTPSVVTATASTSNQQVRLVSKSSTTFVLEFRTGAGALTGAVAVSADWIATG